MKTYELTYIISPEITLEEAETEGKNIGLAIQDREGIILKQSNPSAKTLSYPIKKQGSGFFGVFEFQLEPEKLSELKEKIIKNGKIARYMVIIKEAYQLKKGRRTPKTLRVKPSQIFGETKAEFPSEPKGHPASEEKQKVELKDIEQKLDELLNE